MKLITLLALVLQFGPRPLLTPAETLLDPEMLRAIEQGSVGSSTVVAITGADPAAGEIALVCLADQCDVAERAATKLGAAMASEKLPRPARAIRVVTSNTIPRASIKAAVFVAPAKGKALQVVRGLWSTADVADEVVEIFARQAAAGVEVRP